jgi:carbonic anhydrase
MITSVEALERLKDGNLRFTSGKGGRDLDFEHVRRNQLVKGQAPFAVVLGCSDSRVPLELIFDQGLGDLFVIRVAGNIAASSQLGSIEFATEKFGTPLLVVLGHSRCGAVEAAVDAVLGPVQSLSPNMDFLAGHICPVVQQLLEQEPGLAREGLVSGAVGANVRAAMARISKESEVLDKRIENGQLKVVGAEYSLETGKVEFLE